LLYRLKWEVSHADGFASWSRFHSIKNSTTQFIGGRRTRE
jgi:hypothetical protein